MPAVPPSVPPSLSTSRRVLLVLRHGKAAWPEGVGDHRRPLAGRGRRDVPLLGPWLVEADLVPDLVLFSDAARTTQTAELLLACLPVGVTSRAAPALYEASVDRVLALVATTAEPVRCLLLVGHEPTSSSLVAVLTGASPAFPTAAVAAVALGGAWADVTAGAGELVAFRTPKG